MRATMTGRLFATTTLAVLAATPTAQEPDLNTRARAIHERVITLDTHNDVDRTTSPAAATTPCR